MSQQAHASGLDGSVATWGDADCGGDSSIVQAELKQGMDTIYSTRCAFAAKMLDGSVVTWGAADYGGDSSTAPAVQAYNMLMYILSSRRGRR